MQDVKFRVKCSFCEIYSESITDLLPPPPPAEGAQTKPPGRKPPPLPPAKGAAPPSLQLGYAPLQHGCYVKELSSHEVQNGEQMTRAT